ncbi:Bgt-4445 [Blumeria graminis f. sp. tritici]|uniref:Bgt-4445 n=2 Tax=Blumeria graminis f. sp. tritici TaxID=62690 RepID=A0A381L427_BLUGR|nr:RNA-binding protein [Blumeria graminis f. sp. tritici 96224]VCU39089.1 Bgt-4445 [Blumeria graminis f. sp. tritici]
MAGPKTDLSRQERKARKRAALDEVRAVPGEAENNTVDSPPPSKKRKRSAEKPKAATTEIPDAPAPDNDASSKRARKAEARARRVLEKSTETPSKDLVPPAAPPVAKPSRFIVFVGNLPYTATQEAVAAHFATLRPISVRNLTRKSEDVRRPARGIAFVEFASFDTHKTALATMHHSLFDDGLSEPRRINVELTAGGGGNKDGRQSKIKIKNERLNQQRLHKQEEKNKIVVADKVEKAKKETVDESTIHPSRRKMMAWE